MSVQQLREATRVARKAHRCSLCDGPIDVGDPHHVSTNVYDGRVYDWRTCGACREDGIVAYVDHWCGWPEEGVGYDSACEWADEARRWAEHPQEKAAAEAFRDRRDARRTPSDHSTTPDPTTATETGANQ